MSDLIKREDAAYKVEVMLTLFRISKDIRDEAIDLFINSIPAVEPKVGQWISVIDEDESKCSECGKEFYYPKLRDYHYCPNCGAKME